MNVHYNTQFKQERKHPAVFTNRRRYRKVQQSVLHSLPNQLTAEEVVVDRG